MPPELESLSKEDLRKISDVKLLVSQLYEALNIEDYQLAREQELVKVILAFDWAIYLTNFFDWSIYINKNLILASDWSNSHFWVKHLVSVRF